MPLRSPRMSWDDLQTLAATLCATEISSIVSGGGEALLRERLASLSPDERRVLGETLGHPELV
jgi:hypothetical protein